MFVKKNFSVKDVLQFSGGHFIWLILWSAFVAFLYFKTGSIWFTIPWLPLSLIGTAVAFYVGFKNNQSYDRMWEARKIWGAIVNDSRSWSANVVNFVSNQFTGNEMKSDEELLTAKRRLIYSHIGWLYALRSQLLIPTQWEHINQGKFISKVAKRRREKFGVGLYDDEYTEDSLKEFLPSKDYEYLINCKNTATQIIANQSEQLKELRAKNMIDDFRHMDMQKLLNLFYTHQGKAERIKKFPLPRQYASLSSWFVGIFIFLLPFGMISEFAKLGEHMVWLTIPLTTLVGWVFLMMELVGDYSENPFEGTGNDIPMLALCRTIEIDLREMLGETELPSGIQPKNNVLM